MLGLPVSAAIVGGLVTMTGSYRPHPVWGAIALLVANYLYTTMNVNTSNSDQIGFLILGGEEGRQTKPYSSCGCYRFYFLALLRHSPSSLLARSRISIRRRRHGSPGSAAAAGRTECCARQRHGSHIVHHPVLPEYWRPAFYRRLPDRSQCEWRPVLEGVQTSSFVQLQRKLHIIDLCHILTVLYRGFFAEQDEGGL